MSHLPADDPSHCGIMAQPLGVVDVLVSGKPTEHRLPQHTDKGVPAVFAGAGVGEPLADQIRKAESIVKLVIGKKPSIGGDARTAKLVNRRSKSSLSASNFGFTCRIRHNISFQISLTCYS